MSATASTQGNLTGLKAARLLAGHIDGVLVGAARLRTVRRRTASTRRRSAGSSVAATGGYGRAVLAPFSDIDLLFLTQDEPSPAALRAVEFMLYFLWDLGLKVGHATRSVADCLAEAKGDATVRTSLLDARRIAGDAALFADFAVRSAPPARRPGPAGYIAAKQAERAARHRRYGDSPFVVEPNIKEGRGGLRDLQTLYWMARYVFGISDIHELAACRGPGPPASSRPTRRGWRSARGTSCGRCASICTTSPAAPRNA